MRRKAELTADANGPVPIWEVNPSGCPIAVHLKAIGEPPRACCTGVLASNGAVPMRSCKFYQANSGENSPDGLTVECLAPVEEPKP